MNFTDEKEAEKKVSADEKLSRVINTVSAMAENKWCPLCNANKNPMTKCPATHNTSYHVDVFKKPDWYTKTYASTPPAGPVKPPTESKRVPVVPVLEVNKNNYKMIFLAATITKQFLSDGVFTFVFAKESARQMLRGDDKVLNKLLRDLEAAESEEKVHCCPFRYHEDGSAGFSVCILRQSVLEINIMVEGGAGSPEENKMLERYCCAVVYYYSTLSTSEQRKTEAFEPHPYYLEYLGLEPMRVIPGEMMQRNTPWAELLKNGGEVPIVHRYKVYDGLLDENYAILLLVGAPELLYRNQTSVHGPQDSGVCVELFSVGPNWGEGDHKEHFYRNMNDSIVAAKFNIWREHIIKPYVERTGRCNDMRHQVMNKTVQTMRMGWHLFGYKPQMFEQTLENIAEIFAKYLPEAHPDKETVVHHAVKIKPNAPCICGSKKKFKKCCYNK